MWFHGLRFLQNYENRFGILLDTWDGRSTHQRTRQTEKTSKYNHWVSGIRTDDIRVRAAYNRTDLRPTATMMDTNEYSPSVLKSR